MNRKSAVSFIVSLLLSAVALYFAFRNVPLKELWRYLIDIHWGWAALSAVMALSMFPLRAWRWQIILASTAPVKFWNAYHPLMIGFMLNCVLPGRVGELARPLILQRREGVPFTAGIATVAVERVFDLIMLVTIFAWVMSSVNIDPALEMHFGDYVLNRELLMRIGSGMIKLSLVLIFGVILVSVDTTRRWIKALTVKTPQVLLHFAPRIRAWVDEKVSRRLVAMIDNVASGFALVRRPSKIIACLLISALVWSVNAGAFYAMSRGCPGMTLGFLELFAVMIIICYFIALPSVPGFWGIWEAGGVFALALFGVAEKSAAGYTLANHAVQILPVILAGLVSAVITGVNIFNVSRVDNTPAAAKTTP